MSGIKIRTTKSLFKTLFALFFCNIAYAESSLIHLNEVYLNKISKIIGTYGVVGHDFVYPAAQSAVVQIGFTVPVNSLDDPASLEEVLERLQNDQSAYLEITYLEFNASNEVLYVRPMVSLPLQVTDFLSQAPASPAELFNREDRPENWWLGGDERFKEFYDIWERIAGVVNFVDGKTISFSYVYSSPDLVHRDGASLQQLKRLEISFVEHFGEGGVNFSFQSFEREARDRRYWGLRSKWPRGLDQRVQSSTDRLVGVKISDQVYTDEISRLLVEERPGLNIQRPIRPSAEIIEFPISRTCSQILGL